MVRQNWAIAVVPRGLEELVVPLFVKGVVHGFGGGDVQRVIRLKLKLAAKKNGQDHLHPSLSGP